MENLRLEIAKVVYEKIKHKILNDFEDNFIPYYKFRWIENDVFNGITNIRGRIDISYNHQGIIPKNFKINK